MKKPNLLTDVDGVLIDWVKAFGQYAESQGFQLTKGMKTPHSWEMTEWLNVDHATIRQLITEMNSSKLFASLPVFKDAVKYLPLIADKYNLIAITCCSTDPLTIKRRKKNLEMLPVKFKEVHCLNFTDSKSELLKAYHPTFWVEDRVEGAIAGHEAGHTSIIRNTTYNKNLSHQEIIRVDNWKDIVQLIHSKK